MRCVRSTRRSSRRRLRRDACATPSRGPFGDGVLKPAAFAYVRPNALAGAIDDLTRFPENSRVIAGGQSLGPWLNLRLAQPKHAGDISRIDILRGPAIEGDVLAIDACVSHAQIEDGEIPDLTSGLPPRVARG